MTQTLQRTRTIRTYEILPRDSHKSFYGKAKVTEYTDGAKVLTSYQTPVLMIAPTGEFIRLWDGWSATTGRHIAAFAGINKAAYLSLAYADMGKYYFM